MSISLAIPLFLLIIGGLSIWMLIESSVHWIFKSISTITLCSFSVALFFSLQTFLGWPSDSDLPEKVSIRSVVIKEPNKNLHFAGRIYFLLDSVKSKYNNKMLDLLGHKSAESEPRLFSVPYSRQLHEELEKSVIPGLKNGQIVQGKMTKSKGKGGKQGKPGEGKDGKGGGSESQEQEYQFYILPPSETQRKNPEF